MKKSIVFLVLLALGMTVENTFAGGGPPPAPDGGSTALMLTAGLGGLTWVWKRARR